MQTISRKLLAIAVIAAFAVIMETYDSPPAMISFDVGSRTFFVPSIGSFLLITILFVIGAVVARGGFLALAIAFSIGLWFLTQFLIYAIGTPAGPVNVFGLMFSNLPALLANVAAAALGATIGGWYYSREFAASQSAS